MSRPAAMPTEPRPACTDVDVAEEEIHQWLLARGITDRRTLWCGTLVARATVWLVHLRLAYQSDRYAEQLLQLAKLEVRVRVLRHQLADPNLHPLARPELIHQLGRIDYTHLPFDVTVPPAGWMESP